MIADEKNRGRPQGQRLKKEEDRTSQMEGPIPLDVEYEGTVARRSLFRIHFGLRRNLAVRDQLLPLLNSLGARVFVVHQIVAELFAGGSETDEMPIRQAPN